MKKILFVMLLALPFSSNAQTGTMSVKTQSPDFYYYVTFNTKYQTKVLDYLTKELGTFSPTTKKTFTLNNQDGIAVSLLEDNIKITATHLKNRIVNLDKLKMISEEINTITNQKNISPF